MVDYFDSGTFLIAGTEQEYYISPPESCEDAPLFGFTSPQMLYIQPIKSLVEVDGSDLVDWKYDQCEFCKAEKSRIYLGHRLSELFQDANKNSIDDIEEEDIPEMEEGRICSSCIVEVSRQAEEWTQEHETIAVTAFI